MSIATSPALAEKPALTIAEQDERYRIMGLITAQLRYQNRLTALRDALALAEAAATEEQILYHGTILASVTRSLNDEKVSGRDVLNAALNQPPRASTGILQAIPGAIHGNTRASPAPSGNNGRGSTTSATQRNGISRHSKPYCPDMAR